MRTNTNVPIFLETDGVNEFSGELELQTKTIENGNVRVEVQLNTPPKITITEYGKNLKISEGGFLRFQRNLEFMLESSTIKELPPHLQTSNFVNERTNVFTHASKRVLEKPFKLAKIITTENVIKKTGKYEYVEPSKILPDYIKLSKGKIKIERITKEEAQNSEDLFEYTSIRELLDPLLNINEQVLSFKEDLVLSQSLGNRTRLSPPVEDVTCAVVPVATYKDTVLTWEEEEPFPEVSNTYKDIKVIRKSDEVYYTYEGDWNPHIRPPGASIPRDLGACFDSGGITKQFKITKYLHGQPESEIEGIFGFANVAIELIGNPIEPNTLQEALLDSIGGDASTSGNALHEVASSLVANRLGFTEINFSASMYWRLVSVKAKRYTYTPVPYNLTTPFIRNSNGTIERVHIPEEYNKFLRASNLQVLTSENTYGWELKRFESESSTDWRNNSVGAWIKLNSLKTLEAEGNIGDPRLAAFSIYKAKLELERYLFRRVPLIEKTNYAIASYSKYYKDASKITWDVQEIPKNQLEEYRSTNDSTPIQVLFPDVNWSPELMLISKTRFSSSIATMGNPEWNPFASNYYETNPTTIATGSEEYEYISYSILPSGNTTDQVTELYNGSIDINGLMSAARSSAEIPGTMYQNKDFTTISDYGLPEAPYGAIDFGQFSAFASIGSSNIDKYTEFITHKTVTGVGSKNHKTTTMYNLAEGRPPSASVRKPIFEAEVLDCESGEEIPPYADSKVLITSAFQNPFEETILTYHAKYATTEKEAQDAAGHELRMSQINASTANITLSFDAVHRFEWGEICGKNLMLKLPTSNMAWVVKAASADIQFADGQAFAQPLQLTLGGYIDKNVAGVKVRKFKNRKRNNSNENEGATSELDLDVNLGFIGSSNMSIPAQYSRWVNG